MILLGLACAAAAFGQVAAPDHEPKASRQPTAPVGDTALLRSADPDLPFVAPNQPAGLLLLPEVLAAVNNNLFPAFTIAERERLIARGNLVAALGEFDVQARIEAVPRPLGFYKQDERFNAYLEQNVLNDVGTKTLLGYRRNRGKIASWEDYETNDGGEFYAGLKQPLLRNRAIDKKRAAAQQAELGRDAAEAAVRRARIEFHRDAAAAYWDWLAAGANLAVERKLLALALDRDVGLRKSRAAGLAKPLDQVNNDRTVFERQGKTLSALQKYQKAAVKLSLFHRDAAGCPLVPSVRRLPGHGAADYAAGFPEPGEPRLELVETDVALACRGRPELAALDVELRQQRIEVAQYGNLLLPGVDFVAKASQDVGGPAVKKDKTPFLLEAGVVVEMPLQRRFARGKLEASQAKFDQLQAKRRYAGDKVAAEVRAGLAELRIAFERVDRARRGRGAALESERMERAAFKEGLNDLFRLLLAEAASAGAAQAEVEALAGYFSAHADYFAALGRLPDGAAP